MKRTDTFMLGMAAFLAANCISYFVRSELPYVTGWGMRADSSDYMEAIGFPFAILSVVKTQTVFSLVNLWGDLVVAILGSTFLAGYLAHRLPPLWERHCRRFRYSLRGTFVTATLFCVFFGVAVAGPGWGLTVRNTACLAAPPALYVWYLHCRTLGWLRLTTAAVGLTLFAILLAYRYEDPFFFADRFRDVVDSCFRGGERLGVAKWNFTGLHFACVPIIRAAVPVFGIFSFLVLLHAVYDNYVTHRQLLKHDAQSPVARPFNRTAIGDQR